VYGAVPPSTVELRATESPGQAKLLDADRLTTGGLGHWLKALKPVINRMKVKIKNLKWGGVIR